MGVPFEALIPYGIIIAMFGVTGAGLTAAKYFGNEGKKARWNKDLWDRCVTYRLQCLQYSFLFAQSRLRKLTIYICHSDGKRLENHRNFTRPVRQCRSTKGIRCQQPMEA
ncbi:hypothetical protein V6Z79_007954 [Aspergillus fumigatus]